MPQTLESPRRLQPSGDMAITEWSDDMTKRTCSVPDCTNPSESRGLCNKHYIRLRTKGTTEPRRIPTLRERFYAHVDTNGPIPSHVPELGPCHVWTASLDSKGYGQIRDKGRTLRAHKVAWELAGLTTLPGQELDHLCHRRHCVNVAHLQAGTHKQNQENRAGAQRNNASSRFRGVSYDKRRGKWYARAQHYETFYWGGSFDSEKEAAEAAEALRRRLYGRQT